MRFWIQLSRLTGPLLVAIPAVTLNYWFSSGLDPLAVAIPFGLWCFFIGYIDRGWTEYLQQNDLIN